MYKAEEIEVNDVPRLAIELDSTPGVQFVIGEVKFNEVDNQAVMSYNYDVIAGDAPPDMSRKVGDFIVWMLENANDLEHPVVYKGGTD